MSLRHSNNNNTPFEILARTPITSSMNETEKKLLSLFQNKYYWYKLERDNRRSILEQMQALPRNSDGSMESHIETQYKELKAKNATSAMRIDSYLKELRFLAETNELKHIVFSEQMMMTVSSYNNMPESKTPVQKTTPQEERIRETKEPRANVFKSNWLRHLRRVIILVLILSLAWGIDRFVLSHEVEGLHTICYVTNTGECYHSSNCSYLRSRNKTTVYRAIRRGYRDCSRCSIGELDVSTKHEPFWSLVISTTIIGLVIFIGKKER